MDLKLFAKMPSGSVEKFHVFDCESPEQARQMVASEKPDGRPVLALIGDPPNRTRTAVGEAEEAA